MTQFNKKRLLELLKTENDRILDLLNICNVPDSVEDNACDEYLLQHSKEPEKNINGTRENVSIDELQERLATIKNKMKAKKRPTSERSLKKREAKKLKKNKEFKKVLISAAKAAKNENQKVTHYVGDQILERKNDIKQVKPKPVFNEEGKIVFSKFDFASHPGAKVKRSHQNPREILKKIKETDKKIEALQEQGDTEKALELKNEIAWKKVFEKTEGKKVKDDPKLLYKAIKKRKDEKKKSKKEWQERKKNVDSGIEQRQKKRQENIEKRIKSKKTKKLKQASKRGRVIPGF